MTTVIVFVDYKGGSGKTTSAVWFAHNLHAWRNDVVLIDGDAQQTAKTWCDLCMPPWPFPVVDLSAPGRMRSLFSVIDERRFGTILIDTPPLETRNGVVEEALQHATLALVPLAPSTSELHRVPATWAAIDRYAPGVPSAALLNRVSGSVLARDTRNALEGAGHMVLQTEIPRRESYAGAFPGPVSVSDVPYEMATRELMDWGVA